LSAMRLQEQQQQAEARQKAEDDRNNVPEDVRQSRKKGALGHGPLGTT
jgi:hypothetical protein